MGVKQGLYLDLKANVMICKIFYVQIINAIMYKIVNPVDIIVHVSTDKSFGVKTYVNEDF